MPLAPVHNSMSVQFYVDVDETPYYLGASVQCIGQNGFVHEGNKIGADLRSQLAEDVERRMVLYGYAVLKNIFVRGFIGFDYILCEDGRILLTEINHRMTASTLLFSLIDQISPALSYELTKVHAGHSPCMSMMDIFVELEKTNTDTEMIIPLNPRLFDVNGEMFIVTCGKTFADIDRLRNAFCQRVCQK